MWESIEAIGNLIWVVAAAAMGVIYFFSRQYRAKRKREWRKKSPLAVAVEWGEYLFGFVAVDLIGFAVIATYWGRF